MALPSERCDNLFICGDLKGTTSKFNENETTIEQVYEYVRQSFQGSLPASYRIVYYDSKTMSFVNLKKQLQNGSNPFYMNSSNGVQSTTSTPDCIRFYIVSNTHSQLGSDDDQIVSSGSYDEDSRSTNGDVSQAPSITSDGSSIVIPQSINVQEMQNTSKRLSFLLDVKPHQRDIYKSDQFNVREEKTNGRIARVQGLKRDDQKMLQVLPKLQIPSIDSQSTVTLLVAVVSEELNNGIRIWSKHSNKGFLPEGYGKDTEPMNPITFDLNQTNMTSTGEFTLSLQMITKWNKSQREREEVYRFDDQKTRALHAAEHDANSPRLLCVLQRNGVTDWDTFCLSDFIRTPKSSEKRSSSVSLGRSPSPKRKRSKTED